MALSNYYEGKNILLFGGASFVGGFIIDSLLSYGASKIIVIDNSEDKVFWLTKKYQNMREIVAYVCDVENLNHSLPEVGEVDFAIYLAAKKHVGLSEVSPIPAMRTNAEAVSAAISLCEYRKCKKFMYVSSDKAVNPTNVMGATKLIGEKVAVSRSGKIICSVVRFGNIIGSPGSLLPVLETAQQSSGCFKLRGGDRTTRFFMVPSEASRLILAGIKLALGGEIFIMKMGAATVKSFIECYTSITSAQFDVEFCELEPGEKSFEELINDSEIERAKELNDFIIVDNCDLHSSKLAPSEKLLSSHNASPISDDELRAMIINAIEEVQK